MKQAALGLQLLGLVMAPAGLLVGLVAGNTGLELELLAVGGLFFVIGKYVLEPRTRG